MNKIQKGKKGEEEAQEYLKKNGFTILEKNYRKSFGELDIVAIKKTTIYGIEVKYVKDINNEFHPIYKMSHKKLNKMKNLIQTYISCNDKYTSYDISLSLLIIDKKSKVEFYSNLLS